MEIRKIPVLSLLPVDRPENKQTKVFSSYAINKLIKQKKKKKLQFSSSLRDDPHVCSHLIYKKKLVTYHFEKLFKKST